MNSMISINPQIITSLHNGEVIAYPTEAVYGLGCDPDNPKAVATILAIKNRPINKGLILIAQSYAQLKPYIDEDKLTQAQLQKAQSYWPGPFTIVMPARATTPKWLTGDFDSIAVRVSAHPVVQKLCQAFNKPLVSTSANLSGQPAINEQSHLQQQLGDKVAHIVAGEPNQNLQPSTIIDAISGKIYR